MPTAVVGSDYQGEIGLPAHKAAKEERVWKTGDPMELLLVLPHL